MPYVIKAEELEEEEATPVLDDAVITDMINALPEEKQEKARKEISVMLVVDQQTAQLGKLLRNARTWSKRILTSMASTTKMLGEPGHKFAKKVFDMAAKSDDLTADLRKKIEDKIEPVVLTLVEAGRVSAQVVRRVAHGKAPTFEQFVDELNAIQSGLEKANKTGALTDQGLGQLAELVDKIRDTYGQIETVSYQILPSDASTEEFNIVEKLASKFMQGWKERKEEELARRRGAVAVADAPAKTETKQPRVSEEELAPKVEELGNLLTKALIDLELANTTADEVIKNLDNAEGDMIDLGKVTSKIG